MPYIKQEARKDLDNQINILGYTIGNVGELNYVITRIVAQYLDLQSLTLHYKDLNEVIGVLECAKQELYRRLAAPYEDEKIKENGDVY